jgi:hypothetical protein
MMTEGGEVTVGVGLGVTVVKDASELATLALAGARVVDEV